MLFEHHAFWLVLFCLSCLCFLLSSHARVAFYQHGEYFGKMLKANKGLKVLILAVNSLGNKVRAVTAPAVSARCLMLVFEQAAKDIAAGLEKKNNTTLKELNLKSNAIKDKGAIALAGALTTNSTLNVLNLSVNAITSP